MVFFLKQLEQQRSDLDLERQREEGKVRSHIKCPGKIKQPISEAAFMACLAATAAGAVLSLQFSQANMLSPLL